MKRAEITLSEQFEKRKNWKNPLVDSVVATFLVREVVNRHDTLGKWEFLVTERVKGAEKGQFQAHHGGFMQVTDRDIYDGAAREVREETGYVLCPEDLTYLTSVGPALYRSELILDEQEDMLVLNISEDEAEPSVGFTLPLFLADVTDMTVSNETDGEVKGFMWRNASQIIKEFGRRGNNSYSRFNYFQFFVLALAHLGMIRGWSVGKQANSLPGVYRLRLTNPIMSPLEKYDKFGRGGFQDL